MMTRVLLLIGVISLTIGSIKSFAVVDFLSHAAPVQATVIAVEHRPGPPKPRQNTPVHVRYQQTNGGEVQATTRLPLLQVIKEGDAITLLASSENPQDVRLPLISELWATPLTYVFVGLCALLVAVAMRANQMVKERGAAFA